MNIECNLRPYWEPISNDDCALWSENSNPRPIFPIALRQLGSRLLGRSFKLEAGEASLWIRHPVIIPECDCI